MARSVRLGAGPSLAVSTLYRAEARPNSNTWVSVRTVLLALEAKSAVPVSGRIVSGLFTSSSCFECHNRAATIPARKLSPAPT